MTASLSGKARTDRPSFIGHLDFVGFPDVAVAVPFYEEALALAGYRGARVVAVDGNTELGGIGRTIGVYEIPNSHSDAAVAAYVSDTKLLFNASERSAQARGLMFVREMPDEVGMLFIHPAERMISMWMKNMLIPLDMVFMDRSGVVTHVAENTVPGSLDTISSMQPALGVFEINGGLAERLGIRVGDRVRHPFLGRFRPGCSGRERTPERMRAGVRL